MLLLFGDAESRTIRSRLGLFCFATLSSCRITIRSLAGLCFDDDDDDDKAVLLPLVVVFLLLLLLLFLLLDEELFDVELLDSDCSFCGLLLLLFFLLLLLLSDFVEVLLEFDNGLDGSSSSRRGAMVQK